MDGNFLFFPSQNIKIYIQFLFDGKTKKTKTQILEIKTPIN